MTETLHTPLRYETFPVGPLRCNCVIVYEGNKALVIDPGGDADKILERLGPDVEVVGMIHTHAHFDHILAAGAMQRATGAPLWLHEADLPLWQNVGMQCQLFGVPCEDEHLPEPTGWLTDELALPVGQGGVLHVPGHTPGSCGFWFEPLSLLVAGDTLFRRGVGRTDLWGGDTNQLIASIQMRFYTLADETTVITGHGPRTSVGEEKTENPYVLAA